MSILLQKGNGYNASYASSAYPTLNSDWTGTFSIYSAYPGGTALLTKAMSRVDNTFALALTAGEILNLADGVYYAVAIIQNTALNIVSTVVEYTTVVPVVAVGGDRCLITMTLCKADGTPAGRQTRVLTNTVDGATVTLGWDGLTVTASHATATKTGTTVIDTETLTTTTNAAGYASFSIIKGQTVVVSCPAFGKTVTVNTTGLDTVDISSYF